MNFNVYLDRETGQKLQRLARRKRVTRNALIRRAVDDLLRSEEQSDTWPREVLEWSGAPAIAPFESHRGERRSPPDDPFA